MTKGTASFGKHNKGAVHGICRRCGRHSFFKRKHFCAHCGFGHTTTLRHYNWNTKIEANNGHVKQNHRKVLSKVRRQVH